MESGSEPQERNAQACESESEIDEMVLKTASFLRDTSPFQTNALASRRNPVPYQQLDLWVRRYVRRISLAGCGDTMADDALQYLLIALIENHHNAAVKGNFLIPWCKRVVHNFVISEWRRLERFQGTPNTHIPCQYDPALAAEAKQSVEGLVQIIEHEIANGEPSRGRGCRMASFERWIHGCLNGFHSPDVSDKQQRHRLDQQHFRDRCVVRKAYEGLRARGEIPRDFLEAAEALGLAASRPQED